MASKNAMTNRENVKGAYFIISNDISDWLDEYANDTNMSRSDIVQLILEYIKINWPPEFAINLRMQMLFRGLEGLKQ